MLIYKFKGIFNFIWFGLVRWEVLFFFLINLGFCVCYGSMLLLSYGKLDSFYGFREWYIGECLLMFGVL